LRIYLKSAQASPLKGHFMQDVEALIKTMIMSEPDPEKDYYALTIFLDENGNPSYQAYTHFVGYADEKRKYELREASLILADRILDSWRKLDEPGLVVNTLDEFGIFFCFGGNAVVEKRLAESVVPEWLAPHQMVRAGEYGFTSPSCLPPSAMHRAPTAKLRMTVLKRDAFRCKICGRSASDHVDIELHVHHIRPWSTGGATVEANLITLCHTCHNGLDPHYEHGLFQLLPKSKSDRATEYQKKLMTYQKAVTGRRDINV
jgi:hypothetical protein